MQFDQITLDVYFKLGKEKSIVYEDAQDGYDYNKGRFSLRTFNATGKEKELIIQQHREGTFETNYTRFKINLKGLPFKVKKIELDNEKITLEQVQYNGGNFLIIDKDFSELHIMGA